MARSKNNPAQGTFLLPASAADIEVSYSGDQPNPHLREFVERHATIYEQVDDNYDVPAFTTPITTTKATAIYNMHTYWSKKPHDAIGQYIRHYTRPGDIVLDPFCGSGGTALAALLDGRKTIAIDRSPAATFITKNYCTPVDPEELLTAFTEIERTVQAEMDWLYGTRCDRCDGPATTAYTVYSQIFRCPRCLAKVPLFDCVQVDAETAKGKPKKVNICPNCHTKGFTEVIRSQSEKFGSVPVQVSYVCLGGCTPARSERRHDDHDCKKREYFERYDLGKLREIVAKEIPHWYPRGYDMTGFSRYQRDALRLYGVKEVADLFTKRNLWAIAAIRAAAEKLKGSHSDAARMCLTGTVLPLSRMHRHIPDKWAGNGLLMGTYYMPQISSEMNVKKWYFGKLRSYLPGVNKIYQSTATMKINVAASCQSAVDIAIPGNSIDYIFTDPPYSDTVQYGELNFVWEAWLGFNTRWHHEEIIVNSTRGKTEPDWAAQMKKAMSECFRVLKPGRWLSLCYHDSSEGTWTLVQDIMAEVGFAVDKSDTAVFIDAGQKSYNQLTADKVTKRDLVLNFRKPKLNDWRIRNCEPSNFRDAARNVVREFLTVHPGSTKDRVYDTLISNLVQKGQMEAHDFEALLRSVAEEVQQPVRENLFEYRKADLFGSNVQSRWYLKETADQVDQAEQFKEDAAATRLIKFMSEYLEKRPEAEGVHYSDLFEQYLSVQDMPRRLLADWLPEYCIKTSGGTWRLPDKDEAAQLAQLREQGTLRRIKRFANALLEGVPVRDKDRPESSVDLLDWLRQCRRAGLFEQGRALYEKGGLNLASLSEEQQIEADDNYRICVRRGAAAETKAKPKRKRRPAQDEDA